MRKNATYLLAGACAVLLVQSASAVQLSIVPSAQTIAVGGIAEVGVTISGLGDKIPPSLGAFDITIGFDTGVVKWDVCSLTGVLGMDYGAGTSWFFNVEPAGIGGAVVSLEAPDVLNLNQPDSFELIHIWFEGVSPGVSPLTFNYVALSDELGQEILDYLASPGSITVEGAVPEPAQLGGLLAAFAMGVGLMRSRFQRR